MKKNLIEEDTYNWFEKDSNNEEKILLKHVGGVDISFVKGDEKHACAALVILSYPKLEVRYQLTNHNREPMENMEYITSFDYINLF